MNHRGEPSKDQPAGRSLVELVVVPNEAVAAAARLALEDANLTAAFEPAYDHVPAFGVSVGTPVRIRVARADLDAARAALDDARRVDWAHVDVGDPDDPDAAAINARRENDRRASDDERLAAEQERRAKQLRAYGIALIAVAVGFAFAFARKPAVLFMILAVVAVWLGRAHAISRRRRQIERLIHEHEER